MAPEPSAANRRARIIGLTPDGLSRVGTEMPLWQGAQTRFEESFGEAERPGCPPGCARRSKRLPDRFHVLGRVET
ncbi:hypothetical protein ACWGQ5_30780 [Streptomyces sp. NPDC055722]